MLKINERHVYMNMKVETCRCKLIGFLVCNVIEIGHHASKMYDSASSTPHHHQKQSPEELDSYVSL